MDWSMMTLFTPSVPMASQRLASRKMQNVAAVKRLEKTETYKSVRQNCSIIVSVYTRCAVQQTLAAHKIIVAVSNNIEHPGTKKRRQAEVKCTIATLTTRQMFRFYRRTSNDPY